MSSPQLPLLPLILDRVPGGLAAALTQEGVPYRAWSLGAPQGRFVLFDSRRGPSRPVVAGQIPIDVDRFRPAFREDPFLALEDERTEVYLRRFGGVEIPHYLDRGGRRAVRRRLTDLLRNAIEDAGGIWLCLAAYPFPYRNALNVRLDHPLYDPSDFDAACDAISSRESAVSHFFQIAKFYPYPEALARLRGLDLGIQSDDDQSFRRVPHIEEDLRHDLELARRVGLELVGFLPPGGRYLPALPPLLRRIEFPHVVLNDLGANDLPFFPPSSPVLHLPAHAVSLQTLLAAAEGSGFRVQDSGIGSQFQTSTTNDVPHSSLSSAHCPLPTAHSSLIPHSSSFPSSYFAEIIPQKYYSGEPLFFHGQVPGGWGRRPELLRELFDRAEDHAAVWKTTLSRFAHWWRARCEVRLTVVEHDGFYLLSADHLPRDYRLGVTYHRGRHVARMELGRRVFRFSPSALAYEKYNSEPAFRPEPTENPAGDPRPDRHVFFIHQGHQDRKADHFFLRVLRALRGRKKSVA
ncbi:MAG: hypothetical protein JXB10_17825 [Pirellulales bacterium]|nr:hypothetical protein [Pirellulales bacterium]